MSGDTITMARYAGVVFGLMCEVVAAWMWWMHRKASTTSTSGTSYAPSTLSYSSGRHSPPPRRVQSSSTSRYRTTSNVPWVSMALMGSILLVGSGWPWFVMAWPVLRWLVGILLIALAVVIYRGSGGVQKWVALGVVAAGVLATLSPALNDAYIAAHATSDTFLQDIISGRVLGSIAKAIGEYGLYALLFAIWLVSSVPSLWRSMRYSVKKKDSSGNIVGTLSGATATYAPGKEPLGFKPSFEDKRGWTTRTWITLGMSLLGGCLIVFFITLPTVQRLIHGQAVSPTIVPTTSLPVGTTTATTPRPTRTPAPTSTLAPSPTAAAAATTATATTVPSATAEPSATPQAEPTEVPLEVRFECTIGKKLAEVTPLRGKNLTIFYCADDTQRWKIMWEAETRVYFAVLPFDTEYYFITDGTLVVRIMLGTQLNNEYAVTIPLDDGTTITLQQEVRSQ